MDAENLDFLTVTAERNAARVQQQKSDHVVPGPSTFFSTIDEHDQNLPLNFSSDSPLCCSDISAFDQFPDEEMDEVREQCLLSLPNKSTTNTKTDSSLQASKSRVASRRTSALKAQTTMKDIAANFEEVSRVEKLGTSRKVEKKKKGGKSSLQINPETSNTDEERLAKMEKNRQSARDCRKRKKLYIQGLEKRVQTLENELSLALDEIRILRERLQRAKSQGSLK